VKHYLYSQRHTHSLPARFRSSRLLIVGCGDVGMRMSGLINERTRLFGTTRSPSKFDAIRSNGITPLHLDLLDLKRCRQLVAVANRIVVLAPPPNVGSTDPHTLNLIRALNFHRAKRNLTPTIRTRMLPQICYVSTTGVYGDHNGAWINELTPTTPQSDRGKRRVAAEHILRQAVGKLQIRLDVLRAPGIYAENRLPLERLKLGTPALKADEDVYTNHIHALDLARICLRAVFYKSRTESGSRIYNACDQSVLKMGDYFDLVAARFNLTTAPRVSRAQLKTIVSPALLSFMSESRRINGYRMERELKLKLRYPTVADFLNSIL
jgi:nucleoside-diphosphate-sugar epimerase